VRGGDGSGSTELVALSEAVKAWVESANTGPITRWLGRELDVEGVPRRMSVSEWVDGLRALYRAVELRPMGWPDRFDARVEGWFRATLRLMRPDGTPVFHEGPASRSRPEELLRGWAGRLSDPGLATVVDWWFPPSRRPRHAPPPLPADARPDRPLASLRANWARDGDLVAVDHRKAGTKTDVEVFGQGRPWVGPTWVTGPTDLAASGARPTLWVTHSSADVLEWSCRVGSGRLTRTVVMLRGRRIALLGEQWDGPGDPAEMRLSLAAGVSAKPMADCRGLALVPTRGRSSARVFPLGLPRPPYPTERGRFTCEGRDLVLRQEAAAGSRRVWRPLLVSWDPARNRQGVQWRTVTVAEKSRACPPGVAFAARVSWGRDETLVVYRSLGPPGLRSFLGHQTRAKFLIGLFSAEGDVEPLLKVDE
jgi:hypothetical protein